MAVWIEVATQAWGQLVRPGTNAPLANGVPQINTTLRATASDTGTVIAPADWKSDKDGLLPGFVAEGTWLFIEPDGQSRQVEAISGGVGPRVASLESTRPLTTDVWVKSELPPYILPGGEAGDDTAKLAGVAVDRRVVYMPKGVYRLNNAPLSIDQTLLGEGASTTIKAKAGALRALDINGVTGAKLDNLAIDGNAKTAVGVRITGSATAGSQRHYLERVYVRNCTTGIDVAQGTVTQADKNTYIACQVHDNNLGMKINSVNAQEQFFLGGSFDSNTVGIHAERGSLAMRGTQFQSCPTGIDIRGPLEWINLEDVIFEALAGSIDIDAFGGGTAGSQWPTEGVKLTNCVLQGATNTIRGMPGGAVLTAELCRFVNGVLLQDGADSAFYEHNCRYTFGATYNRSGANARHFKRDLNGWALRGHPGATALDVVNGRVNFSGPNTPMGAMNFFPYSQAVDLPSVAASSTTEVNVPAASIACAVGDLAVVIGAPSLEHGLTVTGLPATLANNLRLRVSNHTGAAIDAASRTFYFMIVRF